MSTSTENQEHFPPPPPRSLPLWLGVLGAPAVWSAQFLFNYALSPKLPAGNVVALHAATALAVLLAIASGITCLPYLRDHSDGAATKRNVAARTRFLARLGVASSVLYLLVIVAQGIATFFLDSTVY